MKADHIIKEWNKHLDDSENIVLYGGILLLNDEIMKQLNEAFNIEILEFDYFKITRK